MKKSTYLFFFLGMTILSCKKDPLPDRTDHQLAATSPADSIIPANFVAGVNNRYFPLVPGRTFHYVNTTVTGTDTVRQNITVQVLAETKVIQGVTCMVVHDVTKQDTVTVEDTFDWYAQDVEGNVWYFGEDTKSFENGVPNTEGSWMAGVDSARAGIIMHANPGAHIGELYYQEFLAGHAEDQARVLDTISAATVAYGTFQNCARILDTTGLEPGVTEHKYYAPGVGLVLTANVAENEREELVEIEDQPAAVTIGNFAFTPATITILAGSTVIWTNQDNVTHTVTADDNSFTSPGIGNGGTYSRLFDTPGTYPYHCTPHPHMKGTVIVQ